MHPPSPLHKGDDKNTVYSMMRKPHPYGNLQEPQWNSVYSVVRKKHKKRENQLCCLILSLKRAENEARTRDPNLGKVMLYQLSYFRKSSEGNETRTHTT